jgi:RNA polymerase sigma-70 factor (ECF subfamily)
MLSRLAAATARHSILDPEYQAGRREELRVLEDTLSNLSPKMRAVFVLVELQGLSHAEVAEALQIPLPTVRTRLFGAKAALRKSLVRHESGEGHEP